MRRPIIGRLFVYKGSNDGILRPQTTTREWTPWLDDWVGAMRAQGNSAATIENW